ncbi:MAG: hypothetical protein HKO64_02915 [Xanthomonadales bacterium]|nr:hypothetical protein [Xanthomonadales bacterium]NNL94548.1 hypothetical protein [Xanthomonadales bacterium]
MDQHITTKSARAITWFAFTGGALLILAGIGLCAMYVVEAVIRRLGEADQSLLFWYLPILFIGLFSLMGGIGLLTWAMLRKRKQPDSPDRR